MDIKEAAHIDAAEHSDNAGSTVRRRIVAAGLSATALSLVPVLAGRAGASGRNAVTASSLGGSSDVTIGATGDTTAGSTGDTAAATTTTAPPKRPTDADITLLSFAQSMELTIRNLYDLAIDLGAFDGPSLEAVKAIREAHEAYAQSISGLLGRLAPNTALDELFDSMKADFSGTAEEVATAARALENTAVATHIEIVGELIGIDGAALIASMLIVEARHATVLATVAGVVDIAKQLTTAGEALSPADYSTK